MLIGEWCSSASVAVAQVANDEKVPMLVNISTADGSRGRRAVCVSERHAEPLFQEREAALLKRLSSSRRSRSWSRTTISA